MGHSGSFNSNNIVCPFSEISAYSLILHTLGGLPRGLGLGVADYIVPL